MATLSHSTQQGRTIDPFKVFLYTLYIVSLAIYGYFLYDGLSYYTLPMLERPHVPEYRVLRPAGDRGMAFGITGALMMMFMLLYSLRKRTRIFGNFGQLSRWLDIHIFLGIMGPLYIILHSTLRLHGIISVAFWSMIAVASSGVAGRYLYLQIPRRNSGEELNLREIEEMNRRFSAQLQQELQLTGGSGEALFPSELPRSGGGGFVRLILANWLRPLEKRKLRRQYRKEYHLAGSRLETAVNLTLSKKTLERRIQMLNRVQQLFHYWHVFHKPFAILMFVIMFIHICVAVWLGYTWIV